MREERRLGVFENRVLRRILGPKRDEVTGEWRKLHNEELNVLYWSSNIVRVIKSRRMRWAGHVACMGERRGIYRVLVGKPEGKRPLGRPRRRYMIYLLTAIGLSPGGCSTVHIYTQTIHRTIQNKQYIEQHNNFGRVRAVPRLG